MASLTGAITICVTTYRRPELLTHLLISLVTVTVPPETGLKIEVLVIDNDGWESGRAVTEHVRLPWKLRYAVEPRRGIAQARNAAVQYAGSTDFIAFVDDDEIVEPQWLRQLIRTAETFNADIVAGPVLPKFSDGVPRWFVQGGFADRPRYATGSIPKALGTGNVLIRRGVFREIGVFDERFGSTGGEDTDFFRRARNAGCKIVWCDEALAHEHIGTDRGNLRSLLRREYHDASLTARIEMASSPGIITCAHRSLKGAVRTVQGVLALPLALLLGRLQAVRALQRICVGAGMLGGLMHLCYEPYRSASPLSAGRL
ncbi:MAG: glycosyltransferase family 2 protein [Bryobacteraceae bacterium]